MTSEPDEGLLGVLAEDELHLAVYGPGFGETVLVRIPPAHWVVVDGCNVGGRSPAVEVLTRRQEHWSAVILTHPHSDHARGIGDVLDLAGDGYVGCTDLNVPDPANWSRSCDPQKHATDGAVEDALSAISDRWQRYPERKWLLRAGDPPKTIGSATLTVLHPDSATVETYGLQRDCANRLSAPILLEWEGVRVLLGADALAPDWALIASGSPDLGQHALLKVPHHASAGAFHEAYAVGADPTAVWIATPFSRGVRLPRFDDGEGCAQLLTHIPKLSLTGLPRSFKDQGRVPYETTRQKLRDGFDPPTECFPLYPGVEAVASPQPSGTNACWVLASFKPGGGSSPTLRYGPGALEVTEEVARPSDPPASLEEAASQPAVPS